MPIQKLETTNVLKEWMDTINTIIDNSSEVESLLDKKVDKETGKGLSSNDFTNTLKNKLDGIEEGANNYSLPTASDSTKGGVTLSDSTSSESGVSDGIAATPKAVKSAYDLASSALPKSGGTITGDLIVTGKINATIEGNTDSANQLSTPRTIALTGDVSGSTTFDGSKDVSITVTVADDSHSHTVENIDNLETMLAAKAGTTSPTFIGTPKAPTATAGTNTTQIATTAFVQTAIDSKIAASDAMIFKGTIGINGTVTELPATHTTGWTYKVITAGDYAGVSCEIGDMIVCLADGTVASDADWTVIQTNIDGAVTGPASAVSGQIAVFDGATGKTIKDSGFTIATSVPANAVFTDTTYTGADGITLTGTKFTNSGVRSISSGTTNGTISVNTNGTSAEVAVKGLGSAAYTESSAYTPVSHITATAKNIGAVGDANTYGHVKLSDDVTEYGNTSGIAATPKAVKSAYDLANAALPKAGGTITGDLTVEGTLTANIEGKASTASEAEKLTTPRTIALTGDVSGTTTFDGSDDVSISVTVADDSHSHTVENIDNLETMLASKASIASPTFTGTPKAPTAAEGTNSTQIATTAFVTTAVNSSVEGAVYGPATSVVGNIAVFNDETGSSVKDSGFSIGTSVPANAKFTDTTYTVGTGTYSGTTKLYTTTGANTDGTINQSALTSLFEGKLGINDTAVKATSDASGNNIVSTYATKEELNNIGDNLADVATSGSYNDLSDKPTSLKNPTSLTIQNSAGTSVGSYDGSTATTVKLTSATVGLGNVTNESKATMFTSSALTGTPTAPTATAGTNTTQIATTAFVTTAVKNQATTDASNYATKSELTSLEESLATVATTGNYSDLTGTPTSLKNPTSLTLQNSAGTSIGTYDGSTATTVKLDKSTVGLGNVTNESKATMFTNAALTGTPTAPTATATTNSTQIATTAFVQALVDSKIAAADAMIYKGTIGTGGTITALPNTHSTGWTYKVITAGTYAGITCNVGDMIVCLTDGTTANNAHWTVIEGNIDGAVTGPASSVANHVAIFDGATGKVIKDSGYTIESSVPSNAVFTDTTYTGADGITLTGTKFTNSGVRSIASGATNGTISVNTNGTSAEVAVKGLGSAAYTASTAYAPASHTSVTANGSTLGHVKLSDATNSTSGVSGGLAATPKAVNDVYKIANAALPKAGGTIDGDLEVTGTITGTLGGNADTATKLASAGTITLAGDATGSVDFDGTDATLTVTVVDDSHNHTVENIDNLETLLAAKSAIASPTFTGTPKAPTATAGTNTTQIATTAFVTTAVANKTSVSGNAGTATTLATARTIGISGGATGTATSFDGSENITIPVTALDVSKATAGTLAIARGGTGLTASPSMLINLASTSAANVLAAAPRPGVTGVLPVANGGTGSSTKNFVDLSSNQTVAGTKTFSGAITKSISNYATANTVLQVASGSNTSPVIRVSEPVEGSTYGKVVCFGSNGVTIIGSGESAGSCLTELIAETSENTYITADSSIYFYTGANTYADKKTASIDASGNFTATAVYNAVWNDYAEFFPRGEETEAGDFVALSLDSDNEVYVKASKETSKSVGIHSDSFGHLIGGEQAPEGQDFVEYNLPKYIPVGLVGRVKAKLIGEVKKGDFIVISDIPGVGRAFNKEIDSYVDIIGMACESSFEKELKRIKVKLGY